MNSTYSFGGVWDWLSYDYIPLVKPCAVMPVNPLHVEGEHHLGFALIHPSQLYVLQPYPPLLLTEKKMHV